MSGLSAVTEQLSLFDADVAPTGPGDLEGLLAGPGQVVRLGGTARVSVVVEDAWRVRALLAEFAERGVTENPEPTAVIGPRGASRPAPGVVAAVEGHIGVRTAFAASLAPVAARWSHGATTRPPDDFVLDGPRLRLWFLAAGRAVGPPGRPTQGVVLRLSPGDEAAWPPVRRALAQVGLPAALLGPRAGGPAFRIVGRRRVTRFVELIGAKPPEVPDEAWPRTVSEPAGSGSVTETARVARAT
jgi:hypothetical protein